MQPAERSLLLHRVLELRLDRLQALLAQPDWAEGGETLHRVRVATRRLRAALELVDPELYPAYRKQSRRLEALTGLLGPVRELDMQVLRLEALGSQVEGPAAWAALEHALEQVEAQRAKARKRLGRGLGKLRLEGLDRLRELPLLPNPLQPGDAEREAWEALIPRAEELAEAFPAALEREDPTCLHGLRIRVKRLRYALEGLAEAFAGEARPVLEALHGLQGALGDHHELALLEAFLWESHGGLQARRRPVLAGGLLDLLGLVAEQRAEGFQAVRVCAGALDWEALRVGLRSAFRMPAGEA